MGNFISISFDVCLAPLLPTLDNHVKLANNSSFRTAVLLVTAACAGQPQAPGFFLVLSTAVV